MLVSLETLSKLTGASRRQVGYWHLTGLMKASGKAGAHRLYTLPDIVAARTVAVLREQGCSLQKIRKAVEHLRKHYPEHDDPDVLSTLTLLTDGNKVYLLSDSDAIMDVLSKQTVHWVVNVGRLILETRQKAETLPLEWIEPVTVNDETYRIRVTHDPDEGGYVVQCLELPGAIEQGDTAAEAITHGTEAIRSAAAFLAKRAGRRNRKQAKHRARSA